MKKLTSLKSLSSHLTLRKKSDEKVNFQNIFRQFCETLNVSGAPHPLVLSEPYKNGQNNSVHAPHTSVSDVSLKYYYIQTVACEKDGNVLGLYFTNIPVSEQMLIALRKTINVFQTVTTLRYVFLKIHYMSLK